MGAGATGRKQHRRVVAISILVLLVFSACLNPFQPEKKKSSSAQGDTGAEFGGIQYGSIVINPENSLQAQTIRPPELDNLDGVAARRLIEFTNTDPGTLTRDPVDFWDGGDIGMIPYGTWDINYTAFDAGDNVIATGSATGVTIDAPGVGVFIDIEPLPGGTGSLTYTVTFPAVDVTDAVVTLEPWGTADPVITLTSGADYNADFATTGTLAISTTLASGAYLLRVQLSDANASGDGQHAPVVKIVQIYANLVSSAPVLSLTATDLRSPPAAPVNMVVEFTSNLNPDELTVYWTDNSNTEEGFRVYQLGVGTPLADVGAGTTSVPGLSLDGFDGSSATDVTLEVRSYNQFGESAPLSFAFRALPLTQRPRFVGGANTNRASWAAASNPGSLNWGTMIIGGGDEINLYFDTGDISNVFTLPASTEIGGGGPPYDLLPQGPFTPLQTYNWRVENVEAGVGRVIYPVNQITIRDGNLYVATGGTANAAGSSAEPLISIQEAVDLAESGETIRITGGVFDQGQIIVAQDLQLVGSYMDATFTGRDATPTTILTSAGNAPNALQTTGAVTIDRLELRAPNNGTNATGVRFLGGTLTLQDSSIVLPDTVSTTIQMRGLRADGDGVINFESSTMTLGGEIVSGGQQAYGIQVPATPTVNVNIVDSVFQSSANLDAPGGLRWITLVGSTTEEPARSVIVSGSQFSGSIAAPGTGTSATLHVSQVSNQTDVVFENNSVHEINNGTGPSYGIWMQRGTRSIVVRDNVFDMDTSVAGNLEAISVYSEIIAGGQRPRIERNKIRVTGRTDIGSAYGVRATGDNAPGPLIANNVIEVFGSGNLASYGIGIGGFPGVTLTDIIHNTVIFEAGYDHGTGSRLITLTNTSDSNIVNNLLVSYPAINHPGIVGANATDSFYSNVFSGTSDNMGTINDPANRANNVGVADPELVVGAIVTDTNWYAPTVNSPNEILSGGDNTYTGLVGNDINGTPRVAPVSVGAYEY